MGKVVEKNDRSKNWSFWVKHCRSLAPPCIDWDGNGGGMRQTLSHHSWVSDSEDKCLVSLATSISKENIKLHLLSKERPCHLNALEGVPYFLSVLILPANTH